MKDSRRIFTESDKQTIMLRQAGRCHDCGKAFGDGTTPEFHHVTLHSQGGVTEPENGIACCKSCHSVRHDQDMWPLLGAYSTHCDPRYQWQIRELFKVADGLRKGQRTWTAKVSMAGGKTHWSIQGATLAKAKRAADCVVILAPTLEIGEGYCRSIKAIDPSAKIHRKLGGYRNPRPPQGEYVVITYSAATGKRSHQRHLDWLTLWKKNGWSFVLVCDEVHHTSVMSSWGNIENIESLAEFTIVQTGTDFRSDENAIAIIDYENGVPRVDTKYKVREAIEDNVVRPASFRWCDAAMTYFEKIDGQLKERRVDSILDVPENLQSLVVNEAMQPGTPLFEEVYKASVLHLHALRREQETAQAKCLIVSRPGADETENRCIERIRLSWKRDGGATQSPWVVTSQDENASDIKDFRDDPNAQYIAAINMISEGVNIPWLMVLALFRCVGTEMLFHQLVGRVMRTTIGGNNREWGRVVLPRTADHVRFAATLESEIPKEIRREVCLECGEVPCVCIKIPPPPPPVCPVCHQSPCVCRRDSRIAGVIVDDARLEGGSISAENVNEHWCQQGKTVLEKLNRPGDEVFAGLLLKTGADLNVTCAGSTSAGIASEATRDQELAQLNAAIVTYGRKSNMATEDAVRNVYRGLGVDTPHDIESFTVHDIRTARKRVNNMIAQEIRQRFSI